MKTCHLVFLLLISLNVFSQKNNKSLTYSEVIDGYTQLDMKSDMAKMITCGKTDCGEPLRLFVISKQKIFEPARIRQLGKCILFINNGIHPGEPDGIDASLELATALVSNSPTINLPDNVVICIVPVFNIDGALERGCCSRINQNGPEEYGFRANSRNLDLNRDFTKSDAMNTRSLISIIREWNPDVFVDTHVSDGADYQYTMTVIQTQQDKLPAVLSNYIKDKFTPALYSKMEKKNDPVCPYVQTYRNYEVPDSGIVAYLETPRYLSGYLSLYNTISYLSESHMLKSFDKRKTSTFNLLQSFIELCDEECKNIIEIRRSADEAISKEKTYRFNWVCDTTRKEKIKFKGFEAGYKKSAVTGARRLFYDELKPYQKTINYYNSYIAVDSIKIPKYFFIPQAWEEIINLLRLNGINYSRIARDTTATLTVMYITGYETVKEPYEGHYLHYNVTTKTEQQLIKIYKGDYLIVLPQANMRYALETLIPRAVDSYFNWGFFDSFLQQKEWIEPYTYEDEAAKLLEENAVLKIDFENWKKNNPSADDYSMLNYIYHRSPNFEKTYRRYPIFFWY